MQKIRKRLRLFILLITVCFFIYNLVWFINFKSYEKYYDERYVRSENSFVSYRYFEDGITYSVKKPSYLSFTGNLAGSNSSTEVDIIIWPSFMCTHIDSFGLMIQDSINDRGYAVYVDENMEYLPDKDTGLSLEKIAEAKQLMEIKENSIISLYDHLKEEFNI